jgi:DNA-dependent RNA polymerase auxiliary subunit epsilon
MSEEKRLDTAANEQPKKKTKEQLYIDEAAKAGAREVLHLQHKVFTINYYRATEDALRAYIKVKRQLEHP